MGMGEGTKVPLYLPYPHPVEQHASQQVVRHSDSRRLLEELVAQGPYDEVTTRALEAGAVVVLCAGRGASQFGRAIIQQFM